MLAGVKSRRQMRLMTTAMNEQHRWEHWKCHDAKIAELDKPHTKTISAG